MGLLDSGGFWQGQGKAKGGDILAGLLAAVGDTLTRNSGGEGYAVQGLLGQRLGAMDEMRKRAEQEAKMREMQAAMQAAGLSPQAQLAEQYGFDLPEPEKPTGTTRLMQESKNWGPEEWDLFAKLNPVQGADGQYYPRNMGGSDIPSAPVGELTPIGGGTGNGAGRFPFRR